MPQYLATEVSHSPSAAPGMLSVQAIAEFNANNPTLRRYDQSLLHSALATDGFASDSYTKGFTKMRMDVRSLLTDMFTRYRLDAIAVPSHPNAFAFTPPNLAGFPIITAPIATDANGVPIGISFYALKARDDTLLQLAHTLDTTAPPFRQLPSYLVRSPLNCKPSAAPLPRMSAITEARTNHASSGTAQSGPPALKDRKATPKPPVPEAPPATPSEKLSEKPNEKAKGKPKWIIVSTAKSIPTE